MCICKPMIECRVRPGAHVEHYGLKLKVKLRIHFGECPLADEVLGAWAVKA